MSQIALELKRRASSIYAIVRKMNLTPVGIAKPHKIHRTEPYTRTEIEHLVAMRESGHSWAKIASALGRPVTPLIKQWKLAQANKSYDPQQTTIKQVWSSAARAELIKLFDEGLSRPEIAVHFERKLCSLETFLREELKRLGRPARINVPWSTMEDEQLAIYKSQGKTLSQIAALMPGRTRQTVHIRFTKLKARSQERAQAVAPPAI